MPSPPDIYSFFSRRKGSFYVIAVVTLTGALLAYYPISQWWVLRKERRLFAIYTAMDDLDVLANGKRKSRKISGTAVVVGGRYVSAYLMI
jgi:hypothetical protein